MGIILGIYLGGVAITILLSLLIEYDIINGGSVSYEDWWASGGMFLVAALWPIVLLVLLVTFFAEGRRKK